MKLEELNITLNENIRNNKDIKAGEYEITYEPMIGEPKTITVKVEKDTTPRDTENFWRSLLSKTKKTTKLEDRQKKIKKIVKA
jgi:DNA-directed RNA polymerase subunit L